FAGLAGAPARYSGGPLVLTPNGQQLWSSSGDGYIYVFDARRRTPLWTLKVGGPQTGRALGFLDGGARAWVGDGEVSVVDTARRAVVEVLPEASSSVALSSDRRRVYVALSERSAIAVFDVSAKGTTPPLSGLAAWWPGDGSASDAWGGNPGRASPTVAYAPARIGEGFAFSQHGATVNFGHAAGLGRAWRQGFTIAAWVKTVRASGGVGILQKVTEDGRQGWRLSVNQQGHFEVCFRGAGPCSPAGPFSLRSTTAVVPGTWYHIAIVGRSDSVALMVNGRTEAAQPPPGAAPMAADLVAGGTDSESGQFLGILDEIVVYARALDAADLAHLMAPHNGTH
ncbi:MAG TPA: LamG-like jellyroll fold domain-containing protein, partial [Terriglobales bacterium]|nr:LamG-like jellyroll fold domain-containing protein [Terriglobales bacterium]